ncbi:hypothetical protein V6N12_038389 [Hibiscus sabdariffa]|uniref:Uncharacterized protein n=1 Tax=Hibiscus sabdariffa TaxID=183260 RepID=A0ABR2BEU5_9ROSI
MVLQSLARPSDSHPLLLSFSHQMSLETTPKCLEIPLGSQISLILICFCHHRISLVPRYDVPYHSGSTLTGGPAAVIFQKKKPKRPTGVQGSISAFASSLPDSGHMDSSDSSKCSKSFVLVILFFHVYVVNPLSETQTSSLPKCLATCSSHSSKNRA